MKSKMEIIQETFDRVTEIISPFTGIEFVNKEILEKAGTRGTKVHHIIEKKLMGFGGVVTDEQAKYLKSFENFWKKYVHIYELGNIKLEKRL